LALLLPLDRNFIPALKNFDGVGNAKWLFVLTSLALT